MTRDAVKTILLVLVVIICSLFGYVYYRTQDANDHLFSRWVKGESLPGAVCTTHTADFNGALDGKIYISGTRMALHGIDTEKSDTFKINSVGVGNDIYVWFDDPKQEHGNYIMSKEVFARAVLDTSSDELDPGSSCAPWWLVDDSQFALPDTSNFKDLRSLTLQQVSAILSE